MSQFLEDHIIFIHMYISIGVVVNSSSSSSLLLPTCRVMFGNITQNRVRLQKKPVGISNLAQGDFPT